MKNIFLLFALLFASLSFSQNASINGSVSDLESNNDPLMFAKVSIKETGVETLTDENGLFKFENLEEGVYTLVYSFVGYESLEKPMNVIAGKNCPTKAALKASTISIEELMLTLASNENESNEVTAN